MNLKTLSLIPHLSQISTRVSSFTEKMHLRTSFSRSRDENFQANMSQRRVPRTIRTVVRCCSSAESICSAITLECELFSMLEPMIIHHSPKCTKYQESVLLPSDRENISKGQQRNHQKNNGSTSAIKGYHQRKGEKIRNHRRGLCQEEIDHDFTRPFRRMEVGSSSNRDFPPKNPKTLQRRCTDPLPMAARKACLQDLVYLDDGRKTALVKRFLPFVSDGDFPPFERATSDESYSSMPLRMPVRKASMEEIRLGCSSRSCSQQALHQ